jgi:hypothetical protein
MLFIANRSIELMNSYVVSVDGQRFGLLMMGYSPLFYSDNAILAHAVNKELKTKMSRNCCLATIKSAYMTFAAPAPVEPVEAPKTLFPSKPKRARKPKAMKAAA